MSGALARIEQKLEEIDRRIANGFKLKTNGICCSFCGKHQKEVKSIIAGPGVYICDTCAFLCVDICKEEAEKSVLKKASEVVVEDKVYEACLKSEATIGQC